MKLSLEQVRHMAKLSRLAFTDEEAEGLRDQLSVILDAVESFAQLDTSGVAPLSHLAQAERPLREDVVTGHLGTKTALANAPDADGGSFGLPRVME